MNGPQELSAPLVRLLHAIHRDVDGVQIRFETDDAEQLRQTRSRLMTQVRAHLLPRVADDANPAVVVLGGSTGAGKSTILNSVVRSEVSPAGVLRPTTRRAVVAHHPSAHVVPLWELADPVASALIPPGVVLLDAPDLDSLEAANRETANRLLEAADLWVFVTTAARYGDQLPWSALERAHRRGLQVAVILNRVPGAARRTVRADLLRRLDRLGLGFAPIFLIDDRSPHEGVLPEEAVGQFRDWLFTAAGRQQSRAIIKRTTRGAWAAVREDLLTLADGVEAQASTARFLRDATRAATAGPEKDMAHAAGAGDCAAGAPTTRWRSVTREDAPLAAVLRSGRATGGRGGRQRAERAEAAAAVADDVAAAVVTLLSDAIIDASASVDRVWREANAAQLLAGSEFLSPSAAREVAADAVVSWRDHVTTLVAERTLTDGARHLLGPEGVADVVVAGAGGVEEAVAGAHALTTSPAVAEGAREALMAMVRDTIRATASPYLAVLRGMPNSEAAKRLRMRAAELRELLDA